MHDGQINEYHQLAFIFYNTTVDGDTDGSRTQMATLPQMAVFIRAKRVSNPLDNRVKARLLSSNYYHHGYEADDSSLSSLVHAFFDLGKSTDESASDDAANTDGNGDGSHIAEAKETIQDLLNPSKRSDPFGFRLSSDVVMAVEALAWLKSSRSKNKAESDGTAKRAGAQCQDLQGKVGQQRWTSD